MTKQTGNPVDAIAGLMQERQRYENWLATLEAKRSVTPPHVFERVKADYETRLRAVTEQLMGRAADIRDTLGALTARLARAQQEESAKRDAHYEAELRADVGELDADEWKAMQRAYEQEIASIARERETIAVEVARLNQILAMTDGRGSEPRRETPPAGSGATAPAAAANGSGHPQQGGRGFDELAFLKSVVDPHESRRGGGGGANRPPAPEAARGGGRDADGGSAPSRSPTPGVGSQRQPTEPRPTFDQAAPQQPAEGAPEKPRTDTGSVPAFLKDVPSEQSKTLKCAECGSMNFPTEWYCERCGSELAAM